ATRFCEPCVLAVASRLITRFLKRKTNRRDVHQVDPSNGEAGETKQFATGVWNDSVLHAVSLRSSGRSNSLTENSVGPEQEKNMATAEVISMPSTAAAAPPQACMIA